MNLNEDIKLDSVIHYDSIEIIYRVSKESKALELCLDYQDEIITYGDLVKFIQNNEREKVDSMTIIAERGLAGVVVRWNHVEGLYQVGETRGYA